VSEIPPWVRDATRPTDSEIGRVASPLDPDVARIARAVTSPSEWEIGRIRPRLPRRRLSLAWLAIPAAALVGLWAGRAAMAPQATEIAISSKDDGLFLVRPGEVVEIARGVRASGDGVVRVVPGAIRVDGRLHLAITDLAAFELSSGHFEATAAEVDVDAGDVLTVASGEVRGPGDTILRPGDRWPPPVSIAVIAQGPPAPVAAPREIRPAPPPVVALQPEPPVEPKPAEQAPAVAAWRSVLDALESHPKPAEQAVLLGEYSASWPDSPFAPEARSLQLLALAQSAPPAQALKEIEQALAGHPPRALELHAAAASIARDRLHDCARAAPHDQVVAEAGGPAGAQAQALLGLCAAGAGRRGEARATLLQVDQALLDPPLAAAVQAALEAP
jgi:hypothetical protein